MSKYGQKPRRAPASSLGKHVSKGNAKRRHGKTASDSKAKTSIRQKGNEGLIDRALTTFAKKLKRKNAAAILRMSMRCLNLPLLIVSRGNSQRSRGKQQEIG